MTTPSNSVANELPGLPQFPQAPETRRYAETAEARERILVNEVDRLAAELAAAAARIAELEADAERYRWLRDNLGNTVSHWFCTEGGDELDAAIDAARST